MTEKSAQIVSTLLLDWRSEPELEYYLSFLEKTGSGPYWSREITFETQQVFNLTGVNVNEITD